MSASTGPQLVFNGVNGRTGRYLQPPLGPDLLSALARGMHAPLPESDELRLNSFDAGAKKFGTGGGVDPLNLAQAGWGVIFASDAEPETIEALQPLLKHRRNQAGDLYREFLGADGLRADESKNAFLARHGVGVGAVVPRLVPYYLLLVGNPRRIPFRFQYLLDVAYAVGRLDFETAQEYAHYAANVVAWETEARTAATSARRAIFFGTRNAGDQATQLSADRLIEPLGAQLALEQPGWQVEMVVGEAATRACLQTYAGSKQTPGVLFTASHGMWFPSDDELHTSDQGALLCQDWPGPLDDGAPIPRSFYLTGEDIGDDADLTGLISMHVACYGAGTPRRDDFPDLDSTLPVEDVTAEPFVAALPRRMLGHPHGALAFIGHVERTWGWSFLWDDDVAQLEHFRSALTYVMEGKPVGAALEFFGQRYSDVSTLLTDALEDARYGKPPKSIELANLWTSHNDARNVIVLGDPAVRLRS